MDIELDKSIQFKPFYFKTDRRIYLELSVCSLNELIEDTDLFLITVKSKCGDFFSSSFLLKQL